MPKQCYFCGTTVTSKEHVPPRCVFPEQKDSNGKDFRRNLITVPSCDAHNSEKSEHDTYLMMVLVSYFKNNEAAQNQIKSKVARAWASDQTLANTIVKNLRQVVISGEAQHAFEIDTERFNQSLELIAHGLHFKKLKAQATHPYRAVSYPVMQFDGPNANDVNRHRAEILMMADHLFKKNERNGNNQEIFWFQLSSDLNGSRVVRMCFFEAFTVVALSSPTTGG